MLLAKFPLLLSCLALAGADVTHVRLERDREPPRTRAEWCEASGGLCMLREDCLPSTHIIASFCRHPVSVCCLPKKLLCENVYDGFCTTNLAECRAKETHHVSELRCAADTNCCVPDEVLRRRQDHGGYHWNNRGYGCGGYGPPYHYIPRRVVYGPNPYATRRDGYGNGANPYPPRRRGYSPPGWP